MKRLFLLFTLFVYTIGTQAQTEPPRFKRVVDQFQKFYNRNQADSIFYIYSPNTRQAIPLEQNRAMVAQLRNQLGDIKARKVVSFQDSIAAYAISFTQSTLLLTLSLNGENEIGTIRFVPYQEQEVAPVSTNAAVSESAIALKTNEGAIHGTLTLPKGHQRMPVVLILAGSGPTDRYGNQPMMKNNSLQLLAEALAEAGIASVRYDKRGVGESQGLLKHEKDLRFEHYIKDAVAFTQLLQTDQRFTKVVILGHSEGAVIGMVAAQQAKANAFISLAGQGISADKLLLRQFKAALPEPMFHSTEGILDSLKAGMTVKQVIPLGLMPIFRPEIQPYIISWIRYNPTVEIQKIKKPILLIQGTNDLQITVKEAQLIQQAKPEATLQIIEGMNHVLKQVADSQQNQAAYTSPNLPLHPALIHPIRTFITHLK